MRTCKKCGKPKPEDRFATYKQRNGATGRRGICWDCRGEYAQENADRLKIYRQGYNRDHRSEKQKRAAEIKAITKAVVDDIKAVGKCADCGHQFPPVAMDFDHVRGPKVMGVASMVSSGVKLELILQEIEKCELVCACCHRVRTAARKENLGRPIR